LRIVIVEEQRLIRELLALSLRHQTQIELVAEAGTEIEATKAALNLCPDVLLLDIRSRGIPGLNLMKQLRATPKAPRFLVISDAGDSHTIQEAFRNGASAFVSKNSDLKELMRALGNVTRGRRYVSRDLVNMIAMESLRPVNDSESGYVALGRREKQVLKLISEGIRSREISHLLNISERTVDVHRRNIMRKLNLHTVAQLTRFAIKENLT
jgi:DNA-binding NarL/FixJ family response regulator